MEKKVAIVGAGISGLIACKYVLEIGLHPIVFEADDDVGGLWRHTLESTKLQTPRADFQFSDFPWDPSVKEDDPHNEKVLDYIKSYAHHFSIIPHIKFNYKVIDIDFVGESNEEIKSWKLWSGNNSPFGSKGKWHVTIEDTKNLSTEVHKVEFVILCIGKYSGLPNIPTFPPGKGPEIFKGEAMHSMDYSALDNDVAAKLIKGKSVTVVGSGKSAYDTAVECATHNGVAHPCTIIHGTPRWVLPTLSIWWGFSLAYLYVNRFGEYLVHKPGEPFFLALLAFLLTPLRWGIGKLVELYLKQNLPMKKYGIEPKHSFHRDWDACRIFVLPELFYEKLNEGSIVVKNTKNFWFSKEGLIVNEEAKPLETDVVIFATGYKGDQKLKNIFKSPVFQNQIVGSSNVTVPLYRQIIHPRIPQLAIIGFAESISNLYSNEMRCKWVAHLLEGNIELPNINKMEKDIKMWEDNMTQYVSNWKSCINTCGIWYNDQLCKDMKCNPQRKKNALAEIFEPYGPNDYKGLIRK